MKLHSRVQRSAVGLGVAVGTLVVAATSAHAVEHEEGTHNCGNRIAYVQARFNDLGLVAPPGGPAVIYPYNDGLWRTVQRNGGYSGSWYASGDPQLDEANTYPACRTYG